MRKCEEKNTHKEHTQKYINISLISIATAACLLAVDILVLVPFVLRVSCVIAKQTATATKKVEKFTRREIFSVFLCVQFEFNERRGLLEWLNEWMDVCMYECVNDMYVPYSVYARASVLAAACCYWNSFRFLFNFFELFLFSFFWPGWVFMLARAWLTRTSIIYSTSSYSHSYLFHVILMDEFSYFFSAFCWKMWKILFWVCVWEMWKKDWKAKIEGFMAMVSNGNLYFLLS